MSNTQYAVAAYAWRCSTGTRENGIALSLFFCAIFCFLCFSKGCESDGAVRNTECDELSECDKHQMPWKRCALFILQALFHTLRCNDVSDSCNHNTSIFNNYILSTICSHRREHSLQAFSSRADSFF